MRPPTRRLRAHHRVNPYLGAVDRMKQKCFQITTKQVRRSQQFQIYTEHFDVWTAFLCAWVHKYKLLKMIRFFGPSCIMRIVTQTKYNTTFNTSQQPYLCARGGVAVCKTFTPSQMPSINVTTRDCGIRCDCFRNITSSSYKDPFCQQPREISW